ncbi:hypothetical protein C4K27_2332 [Pseudomonas chlororaphis subsp. chlororaphis]|nr:hypothetical protein C4K27_2332 [Pseudomonas chlororaphis subsp. chlororaphis]
MKGGQINSSTGLCSAWIDVIAGKPRSYKTCRSEACPR